MHSMITKAIIQMSQERVEFENKRFANKKEFCVDEQKDFIVEQIKRNGYYVIENYYNSKQCEQLINEIDRVHELYKGTEYLQVDTVFSDHRIFGAEVASDLINDFHTDQYLIDIGSRYLGCQLVNSSTLAAKLNFANNNLGSGGGWHRDAHHFQFKAIIYLSDVSIDNGPFQVIDATHRSGNALRNMVTMDIEDMTTRYTHKQIQKVIDENPNNYKIITAKAGTVILVDTSILHAGMPIKKDIRYSLFNYYYPIWDDIEKRRNYLNSITQ